MAARESLHCAVDLDAPCARRTAPSRHAPAHRRPAGGQRRSATSGSPTGSSPAWTSGPACSTSPRTTAAAARAGQVHGHLRRAARRVLPGAGGRPRGPGGGRGAHPLRRRPAPGRAAQGHPGPGRGAGGPPGPHLPRRDRAGAGRRRRAPLGLVVARRRRPGATWSTSSTARSSPCSRPLAVDPGSPLPLHLEPLAQPGGRGRGPGRPASSASPGSRSRRSCPASWSCPTASGSSPSSRSSPPISTRCSPA